MGLESIFLKGTGSGYSQSVTCRIYYGKTKLVHVYPLIAAIKCRTGITTQKIMQMPSNCNYNRFINICVNIDFFPN